MREGAGSQAWNCSDGGRVGGQPYKDPPHSANFGLGLAEKLKAVGIDYKFYYPGSLGINKYPDLFGFLAEKLKGPVAKQ